MPFSRSLILRYSTAVLLIAAISMLAFATQAQAAELVVQTSDGRELTGQVDSKSNDEFLWIRHEEENIVLTTSVAWTEITTAQLDGEVIEVTDLSQLATDIATDAPYAFLAQHVIDPAVDEPLPVVVPAAVQQPVVAVAPVAPPQPIAGPVAALEIQAYLVNLDRDVEPDGLELLVAAVDVNGYSVPVRGNLHAQLWGDRDVGQVGRVKFDNLQRWGERVRPKDFIDGVARYTLRFRTVRPEFDWDLMPIAMLNVRLGVYGEGNFEATVPVEIRQFNPFRDRLQQFERSRFFRGELSEQVRRRNYQFGRGNPSTGRWDWPR